MYAARSFRSIFRLLIAIALAWAAGVVIFGPFAVQWGPLRLSSRDATRASLIAAALIAAYARTAGLTQLRLDVANVTSAVASYASPIAAAVGVFVFALGVRHGTFVAGGADTYGYVSEALLWEQGTLHIPQPLASELPWPIPLQTLTPLGYVPSRSAAAIVPSYPPGLPLLMVAFRAVLGDRGQYYVAPILGAVAIWLVFQLGRSVTGQPILGLAAALILATSAPFLFMLMLPMSDVPATAIWTLAVLLALSASPLGVAGSGAAAGLAVLIRPNLFPVLAILGATVVWTSARRQSVLPAIAFVCGLVPSLVVLALFNDHLYGSALATGYGDPRLLYSVRYFGTNVVQFASWMIESGSAYILLGTAAALPLWRLSNTTRPIAPAHLLLGGFIAFVWLSYLFYLPYDAWWWLRFLLPLWPPAIVLAVAVTDRLLTRLKVPFRDAVVAVIALVIFVQGYRIAEAKGVFDLQAQEARCTRAAAWVDRHTDANAVFLAREHSGMLRLYTERTTIRFDLLDSTWLDRAVLTLSKLGYHAYIALDPYEEALFKRMFASGNVLGRLDWDPVPDVGGIHIYDTQRPGAGGPLQP